MGDRNVDPAYRNSASHRRKPGDSTACLYRQMKSDIHQHLELVCADGLATGSGYTIISFRPNTMDGELSAAEFASAHVVRC